MSKMQPPESFITLCENISYLQTEDGKKSESKREISSTIFLKKRGFRKT